MSALPSTPRTGFDFIQYADFVPFMQRMEAMEQELSDLKKNQTEYVSQQEALKITGLKHGQSLKAVRERPGSLIVVKFEGKNNQTPRYLRQSLLDYNQSKVRPPQRAGIAH